MCRLQKQNTDQFNDWIIAVEWISVKEQTQLAILFAHNYLCLYNIFDKSSQDVYCEEKCILYPSTIFINSCRYNGYLSEMVMFS